MLIPSGPARPVPVQYGRLGGRAIERVADDDLVSRLGVRRPAVNNATASSRGRARKSQDRTAGAEVMIATNKHGGGAEPHSRRCRRHRGLSVIA